jgi:ATP-binding cassette subfamily B protein
MSRFPCVLQDDASTCGVACLATVAQRFGDQPSWTRLREAAGNLRFGTNFLGLSQAAQSMGFLSRAVAAVPEALPDLPTPFVAHLVREGGGHFVVVHEVRNNHLVVADPAKGLERYSRQGFLEVWTGNALLLTRQHALPPALESPSLLSRFVGLIVPHRWLLLESLGAAMLMTLLSYVGALLFSSMVDKVFPSGEVFTLHLFAALAMALALFQGLFLLASGLLQITLSRRVSVHLMFPTLGRLLGFPMSYFDGRRMGDILHRFSSLLSLKGLITQGPVTLILDGFILLMTGTVLVLYHGHLALALFGVLPVMLLTTVLTRIPIRRLHEESLKAAGRLHGQTVSTLGGIAVVKAYGAEELMLERIEPSLGRVIRLQARMEGLWNIPRVVNRIMAAAGLVLIYWIGGGMVMKGELSLGQLVFVVTLSGTFFPPFLSLLEVLLRVQEAMATLQRAVDIVDPEPESGPSAGVVPAEPVRGSIRIEGVSFHYGHEEDAVKEASFAAEPGQAVALVGQSGSGKSTLLKLIQRFYVPQSGRILVDGLDVRDWDLKKLRGAMAMVDQDCGMFAGSILDNLRLAGEDIPAEVFQSAVRTVGLDVLIERLPARFENDIGESGVRLSGGERQRLAIARALARRPRILLLDEATAHLDPLMEREILRRLRESLRESTIIVATHRIGVARWADRVVVMGDGKVLEQGSPAQLVAANGLFARFCGRTDEAR